MNDLQLSKAEAARMVLKSQLLDGKIKHQKGRNGFAEIINNLGYIQIDTISVINRAHHHILWTRKNDYKEKHLHDLQAKDKLIFEYWTHAMSFIPMEDYRYSLPRMKNFEKPKSKWLKYRYNQSKNYFLPVLERIKNEGPLSSSSFENTGKKGGTWWEWKPTKTALEYLFWKGDLMISERKNFQKYYDLRERVLPGNIDTTTPSKGELCYFFVRRALSSLGIATEKEILKFMQPGKTTESDLQIADKNSLKKVIDELCESGEIIPVVIEGNHKIKNYAFNETINNAGEKKKFPSKTHILSPFDNLIIQRERTKRLFDFDYTIECYVPANKRKFGYFVTPILWGAKFIGRLDPKADRKSGTLIINNVAFEDSLVDLDEFIPSFSESIINFAAFNACNKITIKKCTPASTKAMLKSSINKILKK
jgi:uncharacterized protein